MFRHNLTKLINFSTTVDSAEIQHFKKFTQEWWNEYGNLRALHSLNKLRIPLIRDGILSVENSKLINSQSLKNISVLDVGCGGGILSEPLARIGAQVTGIDANGDIIEKAKLRNSNKLKIDYLHSSIEDYSSINHNKHDAVIASEIVEHITDKKLFLDCCLKCLKPGGSIFITTINKTTTANIFGVIIAENVLGLLPKGTHQYEKFIEPHRLEKILDELGCRVVLCQGMFYNFLSNDWIWCKNNSINYALHAVKLKL